jgi:hypothetical protein
MPVTVGSDVVTLGEATSLGFILGVTLGDGTWMGITLCERRGASEGDNTGVGGSVCHGIRVGLEVPCCKVLLNCEEFCDNGGACCEVPDGSAAEKIYESWRSAWSCAVPI